MASLVAAFFARFSVRLPVRFPALFSARVAAAMAAGDPAIVHVPACGVHAQAAAMHFLDMDCAAGTGPAGRASGLRIDDAFTGSLLERPSPTLATSP